MVLLDVVTGLRASVLFALKWADINFNRNEISVTRSIVMQAVGPCKTEASQKPVPLAPLPAKTLRAWRRYTRYKAPEDWVFASPHSNGRKPYWGHLCKSSVKRKAQDSWARSGERALHVFVVAASCT
jgi:integrase